MDISGINPAAESHLTSLSGPYLDKAGPSSFSKLLDHVLGKVNAERAKADQAVLDLAMGRTDEIHNVMLAVTRADLAFRLVLQVRNRLTDAYQQITQIQV